MFKRDPIFWWAFGIFILALLLFAVTGNQLWLALMMVSYLLRQTLASVGLARRYVDERQMSLQYRSSNIGFVVMLIACVVLAVKRSADGTGSWEDFNIIIIIGLAAKALFNVILTKNYREAASKIIIWVGILIGLFSAMDGKTILGTLMQIIPGVVIVAIGLLSKKFPRVVGVLVFGITAALMYVILYKRFTFSQVLVAIVVATPLIIAGICLYAGDKEEIGNKDDLQEKV